MKKRTDAQPSRQPPGSAKLCPRCHEILFLTEQTDRGERLHAVPNSGAIMWDRKGRFITCPHCFRRVGLIVNDAGSIDIDPT